MSTTPSAIPGGLVLNKPDEIRGVEVDGILASGVSSGAILAEKTQIVRQVITAAQLLALKGADLQLVQAPGAGLALALEGVSVKINFGGTAYTLNAGNLKVFLGPSANALPVTADLSAILTQGATSDIIGSPAIAAGPATQAQTENQPLVLGNNGTAQFTLGNGTLDVVLMYSVVQM
jgi:hypothetical protein